MITKNVIDSIYKKYRNKPASPDELDLTPLFEHAIENHALYIDEGNLVIESVDPASPFHTIPLDRIHGVADFYRHVAIVLPNAILFLNKKDSDVNIHIRPHKPSLVDRIREKFSHHHHPDF